MKCLPAVFWRLADLLYPRLNKILSVYVLAVIVVHIDYISAFLPYTPYGKQLKEAETMCNT